MDFSQILICIMYFCLLPKLCSSVSTSMLVVQDELPIFHGMEIAGETESASAIHCSMECLKIGCVGFLLKTTDEYIDDDQCYPTTHQYGYNGTVAVTINGNTCQNWVDQSPHSHDKTADRIHESSLADAKNYCRDPDGSGYNWCYTTNPLVRFEACDTYPCFHNRYKIGDNNCYSSLTHYGYNGTVNVTIHGNTCQNWIDQTPHTHTKTADRMPESSLADAKNYCRDPDGEGYNWCYTTNPNARWEACDTYPCGNIKCRLFSTVNGQPGYRSKAGYQFFKRISVN